MEKSGSHTSSLPLIQKRHGLPGPGQLTGWHKSSDNHALAEQLSAVQRNYEAISAMMQVKQEELRKVCSRRLTI